MPGTGRRMNQVRIEKGRWDHHGMCHGGGTVVETVGMGLVGSDAVTGVGAVVGAAVAAGSGSLGSIVSPVAFVVVVVAAAVVIGIGRRGWQSDSGNGRSGKRGIHRTSRGTRTFRNRIDIDRGIVHLFIGITAATIVRVICLVVPR